ncbi:hypothetical protein VE03_10352 [Pseudogymnoascus sp. 23342-1-I1]|nr:hypothetical protein VE03_10352 [Pseudogymnoascus sp. 23342-1-I1]
MSQNTPFHTIVLVSRPNVDPAVRITYRFHNMEFPANNVPTELIQSIDAIFHTPVMDCMARLEFLNGLPYETLVKVLNHQEKRKHDATTADHLQFSKESTIAVHVLLNAFHNLVVAPNGQLSGNKGIQMLANGFTKDEVKHAETSLAREWMI